MSGARYRAWLLAAVLAAGALSAVAQEEAPAEEAPAEPPPPATTPEGLVDIRQVQLNAIIGEFGEQGAREIGTNLNYTRFIRGEEESGSVERVVTNLFDPRNDEFTVTLPAPDTNPYPDNIRPDASGSLADGVQTQSGAGLTYSIIDSGRGTIEGITRGVEVESDVDLFSKPEVLVQNGLSATVHAGGEIPYQSIAFQNNGQPVLSVTWENTGVIMTVTPTIRPDDLIQVDMTDLQVTELARIESVRGLDLPVFSTRKQQGQVLVPNGKPLVIGGLSTRQVRQSDRKIPFLGDIPILGSAFRGRQNNSLSSTLFIFLTPTVVDLRDPSRIAVDALDFWKSGEWRNRDRIEQEVDAMEQDL